MERLQRGVNMSLFGWRLTNKKPKVESDSIQELHNQLEIEQRYRKEQVETLKIEANAVKKELHAVKKAEAKRVLAQKKQDRKQALAHLKAAERYDEAMSKSTGARRSELKAIVDKRVEQFTNLGFKLNGTITNTIAGLS